MSIYIFIYIYKYIYSLFVSHKILGIEEHIFFGGKVSGMALVKAGN
jgi:hypothetical protein